MSYPGYSPTPPPPGTVPQTPTAYPYGAYHPSAYGHPTTPGAYTYPPGAYQAGVTSYGWSYPYSYVPHPGQQAMTAVAIVQQHQQQQQLLQQQQQQQQQQLHQPQTQIVRPTPAPAATHVAYSAPTPLPQRTATFSAYTPSYTRETTSSFNTGGRGGRRQSNLKGLFTKELKNLMYGFGDDRNPAMDTVNVMEEILIEYITDICQQATGPSKKARLSIDDLRRALSRPADAKKLARMEELLFMQEDIKRARAQFDDDIQNPKAI